MKCTIAEGAHKPGPEFVVNLAAFIREGEGYTVYNSNNKAISVVAREIYGKVAITIHPQFRALIPTGLKISEAEGFIGQIFNNQTEAFSRGFSVNGGTEVIALTNDEQEIFVSITNTSNMVIHIADGDLIAKAIFNKYRKSNQLDFE